MGKMLLKARNLGRQDQGKQRLSGFDLDLEPGQVIGLLGVNGAGKSTTLALLSGALAPSQGQVRVLGEDLHRHRQTRKHIGLLPESPPLYPNLSVDENLDFTARLRGLASPRIRQARQSIKKRLDLQSFGTRLCAQLSKGMAQRVAIAQALIHAPSILILDEPTAGLDPVQAQALRDLIRELADDCGIILASHILADMEQLCQRVIILHNGRKVAEQALDDRQLVRIRLQNPPDDVASLTRLPAISQARSQGDGWYVLDLTEHPEDLAQQLMEAGWRLNALIPAQYNLQALFSDALGAGDLPP